MKQVFRIRKVNYPNKLNVKPFAETYKIYILRKYIEQFKNSRNSDIREMAEKVLKLMKDPRVIRVMEQRDIEGWIKEAKKIESYPENKNSLKLLFLGSCLLETPLSTKRGDWLDEFSSDWRTSVQVIGCDDELHEFVHAMFELNQHRNWKKLTEKGKERIMNRFENGWTIYGMQGAIELISRFLNLLDSKMWDTLGELEKNEIIIHFWDIKSRKGIEEAEFYLKLMLKLMEAGIKIKGRLNCFPNNLLKIIIEKYNESVEEQTIGSKLNFPELIKHLVLSDPELVLKNVHVYFFGISEIKFNSLCVELAKENPDLVEVIAKELFRKEEAA